jgi:hypothetical protein
MKSPIFIIGFHRSGSTLWHNLIAMCPGVMRLADAFFLGPRRQRDFRFFLQTQARDLSRDQDIEKMVELCFARKGLPGLESAFWRFEGITAADDPSLRKEIVRQISASDRSLGAIARIFVAEVTRFSGCERACMKFPVDPLHLPELLEWFPDCKVVHITRDPRASAMSKSNDPSGTAIRILEHPRLAWLIKKAAIWLVIGQYRASAKLHLRFKHLSNYRLFRYEDLLAEPERVLRELCGFIDAKFTDDMLHPEKGRHDHQPSSLTGKREKAFEPEAAIRWKNAISPLDNLIISLLTKGSMKRLSYNPKTHPIFKNSSRSIGTELRREVTA